MPLRRRTAMPMLVPILHGQSSHDSNRLQCLRSCQYLCLTVPTVCIHSVLYSEALFLSVMCPRLQSRHSCQNNYSDHMCCKHCFCCAYTVHMYSTPTVTVWPVDKGCTLFSNHGQTEHRQTTTDTHRYMLNRLRLLKTDEEK